MSAIRDNRSNLLTLQYVKVRVKVKLRPRTGHQGPEGEQRYSSNLYLSFVLDAGGRSTTCPAASTPGKNQNPLYRMLGVPQSFS